MFCLKRLIALVPTSFYRALNALLVLSLAMAGAVPSAYAQEAIARTSSRAGLPAAGHSAPLTKDERVLHALNRFTFGPRPGDEAAVAKMGLDRWFDQQLHPEQIDDAGLDQRMAMYPAMTLTTAALMQRFPGPQMIRQMANGNGNLPQSSDPMQRAIYADSAAAYEAKKKKDAEAVPAIGAVAPAMSGPADAMAMEQAGKQALRMADSEVSATASSKPVADAGKRRSKADAMDAADVSALLSLSAEQRLSRLVGMSPDEMLSFRAALKPVQIPQLMQGFTPSQIEGVAAMQGPERVVGAEVLESRLVRDLYSQRQLQAVMTDFWLNHFSVYLRKSQQEPYYLPAYQRDTVLPNALGNFETLLVATAKSPAMLMYLDNFESIGPNSMAAGRVKKVQQLRPNGKIAQALPKGINENYARELMELHTLGVGGGYTQQDVIEVAKCFTGWTIDKPYRGGADAGTGGFIFEPNRHEPGPKTVLGHVIPEGGMSEGLAVLHILATSPATAHFIAQKLAVRFVADEPSPVLVNRMAATFLKSNGDIKAVLTTMFHSPEFFAPQVYRAKVKTPLEFVASAVRASDADVRNALPLVQAMDRLGMPIYGMQTPNGYSWKADEWVSTNALIARMNFSLQLSSERVAGTRMDWLTLLGTQDASLESAPTPATEAQLETLVLGEPAAAKTRATVLAQFNDATVQAGAAAAFKTKAVADVDGAMSGGGRLMAVKAGRGKRDAFEQNVGAASPLETMAGLLLGSPDFQRR